MWRVRWRAWAIALALLVVLDVGIRANLIVPPFSEDFRIPARTLMGYTEFIDSMRNSSGARVAVVGDSIVAGQASGAGGTLSAHLTDIYRERGVDARAYNFGLPGAQSNDLAAMVSDIASAQAADVIVLNIDYRFYGEGVHGRSYPGISEPSPDWLGQFWALHRHRDAFAAAILGDTPKRTLVESQLRVRLALDHQPRYRKWTDDQIDIPGLRKAFDVAPFTRETQAVQSLGEALDTARAAGIPVVTFIGPLDAGLVDRHDVINWDEYDANVAWMKSYVEAHGATYIDFTDAVPAADIGDSHHPLSSGYRVMAEKLTPFIDPLLPSEGVR